MHHDGSPAFDCRAILEQLYGGNRNDLPYCARIERWGLLWNDLKAKAEDLGGRDRKAALEAGLASQKPGDMRPAGWLEVVGPETGASDRERTADVVLLCVIEEEFNATLVAFGINQKTQPCTMSLFGHQFYRTEIQTEHCGNLIVWIGLVGEARNVVCANFCRDIFERFTVKYCFILVGIAGGNEERVKYGDVVGAKSVVDVEGAVVRPTRIGRRFETYRLLPQFRQMFVSFNPERWSWLQARSESLKLLRDTDSRIPKAALQQNVTYRQGVICAGEKLRRDGKLPDMAREYHDEMLAIEMEGAGFASTCERRGIGWLIFRGIADYANPKKRDMWQGVAALHAALAAKCFLVHGLQPLEETQF